MKSHHNYQHPTIWLKHLFFLVRFLRLKGQMKGKTRKKSPTYYDKVIKLKLCQIKSAKHLYSTYLNFLRWNIWMNHLLWKNMVATCGAGIIFASCTPRCLFPENFTLFSDNLLKVRWIGKDFLVSLNSLKKQIHCSSRPL